MSQILNQTGYEQKMVAGFSLGVYAAISAIEVVSIDAGLAMVKTAYELMENYSRNDVYAMCAIVGLDENTINNISENCVLASIFKVNTLNDTCRIYSGKKPEIEQLISAAIIERAITAASLGVDIPYHHPVVLKEATAEFRKFLETLNWQTRKIPLISSIDQSELLSTDKIIEFMAKNLSTPIHWQKVIEKCAELGIDQVVECGPGITLSQNGRFIPVDLKYINAKNILKRLDI
jgi:[acyl-carrier-protein] S-malonyltransferase